MDSNDSSFSRECPLAAELANQLRASREELTARWLDRIAARVAIDANRVFPTEDLLDHVPLLIDGIADYLESSANEIRTDIPVVAKAMELGALRHKQGFDAYEILKEYEILGGILFTFLVDAVEETNTPCGNGELLVCGHRLFRAVAIIQESTLTHYLRLATEQITEREQRLRSFNRTITHELKNHIGAVLGAAEVLDTVTEMGEAQRAEFLGIIQRNAREMRGTLDDLLELSRMDPDARRQRNVRLPRVAAEVVRSLREATEARGIKVRVRELPDVDVNAAAVELMLTNYLSNAIKYRDEKKSERWIAIEGDTSGDPAAERCEIVVRVRDNGLGVPEPSREKLFGRFFRAHEGVVTGVEGTGLGLSIVRETAESLHGRAWAEFPEEGSVFAFSIPCRRAADLVQL